MIYVFLIPLLTCTRAKWRTFPWCRIHSDSAACRWRPSCSVRSCSNWPPRQRSAKWFVESTRKRERGRRTKRELQKPVNYTERKLRSEYLTIYVGIKALPLACFLCVFAVFCFSGGVCEGWGALLRTITAIGEKIIARGKKNDCCVLACCSAAARDARRKEAFPPLRPTDRRQAETEVGNDARGLVI